MTVEELMRELELLLSDICFSGMKNTQPALLQKLDGLKAWMIELGMPRGCAQIEAFMQTLRAYQLGESSTIEAADKLCACEFYVRNVLGNLLELD